MVVAFLAAILIETGNYEEAENLVESLMIRSEKEYVPANCFTGIFVLKGEHDQLYKCVEKAIREHDVYLLFTIRFPIKEYSVPNKPRYTDLVKNTGLERLFQTEST
jgi:hypothetical protein